MGATSTRCYTVLQDIIGRKPNELKLRNLVLGSISGHLPKFGQPNFCFQNMAPSVTRCHDQLSSCTISEKTNDPILRKRSDGRTIFIKLL